MLGMKCWSSARLGSIESRVPEGQLVPCSSGLKMQQLKPLLDMRRAKWVRSSCKAFSHLRACRRMLPAAAATLGTLSLKALIIPSCSNKTVCIQLAPHAGPMQIRDASRCSKVEPRQQRTDASVEVFFDVFERSAQRLNGYYGGHCKSNRRGIRTSTASACSSSTKSKQTSAALLTVADRCLRTLDAMREQQGAAIL